MPKPKTKNRVNITVDPAVHRKFSQFAERERLSVSGILNDMMAVYCGFPDGMDKVSPRVLLHLRRILLAQDEATLQTAVYRAASLAGFSDRDTDTRHRPDLDDLPPESVTQWVRQSGKHRTGLLLAPRLDDDPETVIGQAVLMREAKKCTRMILAVPARALVLSGIVTACEKIGLEVAGADDLSDALATRP